MPAIEVTPLPGLPSDADDPFPDSIEVRTGTLDNGLRYYVKHNDRPGAKASLRLAVDAGSIDELTAVTGVAHFTEHMMFNGTDEYPENELINVLREFGANFGPDINAYTSFTETVYQLEVPNDDASVDQGLNVLDQWLNAATVTEADTVAERGIILDEWRIRTQTVSGRLFEIAQGMYLSGTPYEGRSPIGASADIEAMAAATLREFYDTWYRPDNSAVIVVGDIDVDAVETMIQERFASAAPRVDGEFPARNSVTIELATTADFALHSDPDQSTVDVEVTLPLPAIASTGTLGLRADLYDELIYDIMIRRLGRDVASGQAPFDDIGPGTNSFVPELDAPALYAYTDADRVDETLRALLEEYERTFRSGFTDDEVATAVEASRSEWDSLLTQDGERQDAAYADTFVANFLDDEPYARIADRYGAAIEELEAVTADGLAERFQARWTNSAPHVIISTPEIDESAMPTRDEVLAMVEAVPTEERPEREQLGELPDALMDRPDAIEPVDEVGMTDYVWAQFDPIRYEYPNGVEVVLNPNQIVQGQVQLAGTSPGGLSMVADDDVIDGLYAARVVAASGLAEFDPAEFAEITSAEQASVSADIGVYTDTWSGEAATGDVEAMLQMIHLYMTQPRFDPVGLNQVVQRVQPSVDDPSINPGQAGTDALYEQRYGGEVRYSVIPTSEQFETLDLDGVERVWQERFGDASDWVFVITGDFDRAEMLDLVGSYLGTLPGDETLDEPADFTASPPEGVAEVTVTAGSGDTASVEMLFTSEIESISTRNQELVDAATAIIDARLTKIVREEFGDSYSPSITSYLAQDPTPEVQTYVYVTGSPDRIEAIADLVLAEITDIREGGLTEEEFANSFAPLVESYGFVDNGQYIRELTRELMVADYDLDAYVLNFETITDVTRADVVEFITAHIDPTHHVSATVVPR